jgi:multiple sugar transport system permease protein
MIMITLIMISTWTYFPFVLIGVLARLQTIEPELYAAAKVDGAGPIRRFFHVTLPQLRNVLFVLIMLRFMFMFTKFDIIWLLSGGGGIGYFIRTLPVYTYMKTFAELQVGAGAALSVIMFLILVGFVTVYFKVFKRDEAL